MPESDEDADFAPAKAPVFDSVEGFRQKAIRRLERQVKDIDKLLEDDKMSPAARAALYMRSQNAINMQGQLMGALSSGPPAAETIRYRIDTGNPDDEGLLEP